MKWRRAFCVLGAFVLACWGLGGVVAILGLPWFAWLLGIILWVIAWRFEHRLTAWLTLAFVLILAISVFGLLRPRHDRDWAGPYERLPVVEISESGKTVAVRHLRDYVWRSGEDYDKRWKNEVFDLAMLDALDLVIEPFGDSERFAHAMLSFGFGAEKRVIVSVEARREKGETFGLLPGLYRQFELMYQITTEEDSLTLRACEADSHLYIVPIKSEPEFLQALFLDMMRAAQALVEQPRFYHSLRSNCTTALFDHMNARLPKPVSYGKEVLFPAQAPALLDQLGWLADEVDWPRDKRLLQSAERVRDHFGDSAFSSRVRGTLDRH